MLKKSNLLLTQSRGSRELSVQRRVLPQSRSADRGNSTQHCYEKPIKNCQKLSKTRGKK